METETLFDNNLPISIEREMQASYLSYAMSVIVGRALPDIRDGLKPVHRRVLYAMREMDNVHNKPYKKSARVVGDVIGKYHPHGDTAVYDTLVRMAQDFSLRYPLVDGQGNFGSVDGDAAAAMRYTEVRMSRLSAEMLQDIEKETVAFSPNYDESTVEPVILPARIPNLLINGASGIAVGMATNIPPHNLTETLTAVNALLDRPDLSVQEILRVLPGPDFPTGGFIYGTEGIIKAYETGRGVIKLRANATIETDKRDREKIVVTEIPYLVNKARLIEKIADLVRKKRITGISDLRDESDRDGMRIVIELKKDAISQIILNQLYKHTALESSFGIIFLAIVDRQPRIINIKEALTLFIEHRKEIVRNRTVFDLKKTRARVHILEGFLVALENIDAVVKIIRNAKDTPDAKIALMAAFTLSEKQSQAILDMRLSRLTSLERNKIADEHKACLKLIQDLESILEDPKKLISVIRKEITEIKERYGDERRSQIIRETQEIAIEDLIQDEEMVITISHRGYIKRNHIKTYRSQRRGGTGVVGMGTKDEDFVSNIFVASMHSYILVFTSHGRVYWLKVHEIPEGSRQSKGKAIVNILQLRSTEKIAAVLPVRRFESGHYIVMLTRKGAIKKVDLGEFETPRTGGKIAISIDSDDQLIAAELTNGHQDVFIATANGLSIRFNESEVRAMGRTARGVRGIRLAKRNKSEMDYVVGMAILDDGYSILTVNQKGLGKRTEQMEYRSQTRGGKGILTVKVTARNGLVVGVNKVKDHDDIMIITDHGKLIRMAVSQISVIGRNTQGVRLIRLAENEKVVGVEVINEVEPDDTDAVGTPDQITTGDHLGSSSGNGKDTSMP